MNQQSKLSECIDFLIKNKEALTELPNLLAATESQRAICDEAKEELTRAQEVFTVALNALKELEERTAVLLQDQDTVAQLHELAMSLQPLLTLSIESEAEENVGFE